MTDEKTAFFVKPHALRLAKDIFEYLELNICASGSYHIKERKMAHISLRFIMEFYPYVKTRNSKNFEEMLKTYCGNIDLTILTGKNIVQRVKDIVGSTNYKDNSPLTIRGKFGRILYGEKGYNLPNTLVHASSLDEVERDFRILKKY